MATKEELEKKIDKFEVNMTRTDRIVNGTENEDVRVDDGQLVPSIRKWQKEMEEEYGVPAELVVRAEGAADRAEAGGDSASASAAAARANGSYASTAAGLAATSSGDVFLVATANPNEFLMYENASGSAVSRGPFTVAGAAVAENAKRGRIEVVGRVSEIGYNALGRPIIAISEEGSVYIENNSGLRYAAIAPLSAPVELATNSGVTVDLDNGQTDALGRYIPVVENIASGSSTGWQSRNKFVLIAAGGESGNTSRWLSGVYDRSFAEANRATLNSVRAREEVTGTYVIERVQTFGTWRISLKEGFVYREGGAAQIIAPVAAASVTPGRGWVIDTESGPFDEYGRIIPQLVTIPTASGWTSGTRHVICGVASRGVDGGPAADRYVNLIGAYRPAMAGPYDGEVAWNQSASTPLPEWDASTRTLSWPNLFMMISGLQSRALLSAGSVVIPDGGFWVALLDTADVDFTSATPTIPATAVVTRTYGGGTATTSWAAEPGRFIPLFVVGYSANYPVRFPPVRGSTTFPSAGTGKPDGLLVVVTGTGEVRIYQPGSNPNSDGAVETVYTHSVNPDVGADVWRINGIYAATRTGTATSRVRTICQTGEIEMAILINGKSDHIGGAAHGDEIKEYVTMLINGVDTPLDVAGTFECKTVEFLQKSKLFEPDTTVPQSNHIATSWKRVAFHVDHVELNNRLEWLQSFTLDQAFLSMLTALRDASGGEPIKITTEGFRSPYWESEDISEIGHPRIETDARFIKLSGPSGYGMEMEIIDGWDNPNRRSYIANTAQYNKLYFDFVGGGYVTEPGEVMEARSRFRIQNSN